MWLVSTLLFDHWFDDLSQALAFHSDSPKTRTYPRLESRDSAQTRQPFEYVYGAVT